jgi:hypothetical protein
MPSPARRSVASAATQVASDRRTRSDTAELDALRPAIWRDGSRLGVAWTRQTKGSPISPECVFPVVKSVGNCGTIVPVSARRRGVWHLEGSDGPVSALARWVVRTRPIGGEPVRLPCTEWEEAACGRNATFADWGFYPMGYAIWFRHALALRGIRLSFSSTAESRVLRSRAGGRAEAAIRVSRSAGFVSVKRRTTASAIEATSPATPLRERHVRRRSADPPNRGVGFADVAWGPRTLDIRKEHQQ